MYMYARTVFPFILFFASSQFSLASETDEVISTASRLIHSPQSQNNHVLNEIDDTRNLDQTISRLPSLFLSSASGAGGEANVRIRGGEANFTSVIIENIKVNNNSSSQGGGFDFSLLAPVFVESVKVLSTGSSAVYGSDGLSGSLIVDLKAPKTGNSFSGEIQNYNF